MEWEEKIVYDKFCSGQLCLYFPTSLFSAICSLSTAFLRRREIWGNQSHWGKSEECPEKRKKKEKSNLSFFFYSSPVYFSFFCSILIVITYYCFACLCCIPGQKVRYFFLDYKTLFSYRWKEKFIRSYPKRVQKFFLFFSTS